MYIKAYHHIIEQQVSVTLEVYIVFCFVWHVIWVPILCGFTSCGTSTPGTSSCVCHCLVCMCVCPVYVYVCPVCCVYLFPDHIIPKLLNIYHHCTHLFIICQYHIYIKLVSIIQYHGKCNIYNIH
jgi:hypothetical protein